MTTMTTIKSAMKNEYSKRFLRATGLRGAKISQRQTGHYRMPLLQEHGGYLPLTKYDGPEIAAHEWEDLDLHDIRVGSDDLLRAAGRRRPATIELSSFWSTASPISRSGWTENAAKAPTLVQWVESIGARFGRVQLLRMKANTLREARWGLHLDNNNQANPRDQRLAVRLWMELTDDASSSLVVRNTEFDKSTEVRIPLPKFQQAIVDSETLYHGGYHTGQHTRYACDRRSL